MSKNYRKHPLNKNFVWRQPSPPYELITREQARLYREQGGFVFYDAFDQAELAALLADLDAAENTANELNKAVAPDQRSISRADEIVFSPHLVARSKVAKSFAQHPTLVALCRDLIGPRVRLYWDQLVYKRPGTADEFPWHQDNGYTFVEPQQYLTCWVALNDATVENGCPWIAPGVHSNGTLHHKWTNLGFQCFAEYAGALATPVPAGAIAVFSSLTPHRTGPNMTDGVRKAYILQYAPDGAKVFPRQVRGDEREDLVPATEHAIVANAPERQFFVADDVDLD